MKQVWLDDSGNKVSCIEKIKVLEHSILELTQIAQETFEDGVLIGINQHQLRQYLAQIMLTLQHNFNDRHKL